MSTVEHHETVSLALREILLRQLSPDGILLSTFIDVDPCDSQSRYDFLAKFWDSFVSNSSVNDFATDIAKGLEKLEKVSDGNFKLSEPCWKGLTVAQFCFDVTKLVLSIALVGKVSHNNERQYERNTLLPPKDIHSIDKNSLFCSWNELQDFIIKGVDDIVAQFLLLCCKIDRGI